MSRNNLNAAADALHLARVNKATIPPISQTFGISGIEDAYAISSINALRHRDAGHRIVGRKIGLTSKSVQQQLGVNQPDFGTLFDDMEYLNAQEIPTSRLIQPKIEGEVAFILGSDLTKTHPT